MRDIRAGMALSSFSLAAIILGMTIGFTIVPMLVGFNVWGMFISLPAALTKFAVFILFVLGVNWAWWRSRLRQQQLSHEIVIDAIRRCCRRPDTDIVVKRNSTGSTPAACHADRHSGA